MEQKLGLVLTGGGARAAYQVGVLKGIAELLPRRARNPFQVICGTSSGALNAAALAINARQFRKGVQYLVNMWKNFQPSDIYRTDVLGVMSNSMRWLAGLLLNSFGIRRMDRVSLLDNTPLVKLLDEIMPCEKIQDSIDAGALHALSITASGYGSGQSVTFYQGAKDIQPWTRARRVGMPTMIENNHLLASSAIPFFFPAVHIHREYFGDGSMRQIAPISPAMHLGASRVLVISTISHADKQQREQIDDYPTLAQIAGHTLDSIFLDSLEVDLERIRRINQTLKVVPEGARQQINLRHVDVLVISPSQEIEKIAERYIHGMPWTIRFLMSLIGVVRRGGGANLLSYLLSEKNFCRALIDMGYRDALARKEEILAFLNPPPATPSLSQ
ncbi:MAG TPA: patatin-like phospholipase family protein [Gallionellaceae bacterium]|nr:patatin-like phospholipase family protein [Gallionellaceae bacterium]